MTTSAATHRLVHRLRMAEWILGIMAALALGWITLSWIGAARDQANWAQELEKIASSEPVRTATPRRPGELVAPPQTGSTIGRLEVPRLGVTVIAREGADARTLRRAVGHIPSTALPGEKGNAAFAGHRDTFFRKLKDVRAGDEIVVTTAAGRHQYVVSDTRIVFPTDVSVLDPTPQPTLTLVTCYPFNYIGAAPKRFIVRARLESESASRPSTANPAH
jgi:sortase A